ncbi:unnamed protein product [Paramecium sonneborni]|uniref:Uncharacterized protein n=1 Tax=Paramecium sonneborni TaxID=65129 RepID=A0A8S1QBP5_9CILI|nr:unnamed protein product [Paramecium sonneborni]CAD8113018.1 unnamed protein product [Paramecium sonneborni]
MRKKFLDKVFLIIVSSTGISLAINEQFAKEGATAIIRSKIRNFVGNAQGYVCWKEETQDSNIIIMYSKKLTKK